MGQLLLVLWAVLIETGFNAPCVGPGVRLLEMLSVGARGKE